MKVKVTPPFPGAGSWEAEVVSRKPVKIAIDGEVITAHLLKGGVQVPASWCEPIPEVVPEPGDICEFYMGSDEVYIDIFPEGGKVLPPTRVLARKPKVFDSDIRDAIENLKTDFDGAETYTQEKAAYERFLSAILGVPYARVDHD